MRGFGRIIRHSAPKTPPSPPPKKMPPSSPKTPPHLPLKMPPSSPKRPPYFPPKRPQAVACLYGVDLLLVVTGCGHQPSMVELRAQQGAQSATRHVLLYEPVSVRGGGASLPC